ncbi:MAG: hypothetical protein J6P72_01290 [Firmicutes bacterium]|nr:hypothetical protein [Bacillota bacterium]
MKSGFFFLKSISLFLILLLLAGCRKTPDPNQNSGIDGAASESIYDTWKNSAPADSAQSQTTEQSQASSGMLNQETIQISFLGQTFDGVYSGASADGVPDGNGTFSSGDLSYTGSFSSGLFKTGDIKNLPYTMTAGDETFNGTIDGRITDGVLGGKVTFSSFTFQYTGFISQGLPEGYGQVSNMPYLMNYMEQTIQGTYNGSVDGLKPSGQGTFDAPDTAFKGSFADGFPDNGIISGLPLTLKIGDNSFNGVYDGQIVNGALTGTGSFTSDAFSFDGLFRGGVPSDSRNAKIPYTLVYQDITYYGTYTGPVENLTPSGENGVFDGAAGSEGYYLYFEGTFQDGGIWDGYLKTNGYKMTFMSVNWNDQESTPFERTGSFEGNIKNGLGEGQATFSASNDSGIEYTKQGTLSGGLYHGLVEETYYLAQGELHNTSEFDMGARVFKTGADMLFHLIVTATDDNPDYKNIPIEAFDFLKKNEMGFMYGEDHQAVLQVLDPGLTYDQYFSSPDQYAGKIMQLSGFQVVYSEPSESYIQNLTSFNIVALQEGTSRVVWITVFGTKDKLANFTFDPASPITVIGMPIRTETDENYQYIDMLAVEVRNDIPQ